MKTEQELRESEAPWPKSAEELSGYIESLLEGEQDYGSCVYAISLAATAAFHYAAHRVGASGFQASCADMDVLRRTRGYKGPFMVIDANDMLYPQYNMRRKLDEAIEAWTPWAKEQADKLLAEPHEYTSPAVVAHWEKLAASESAEQTP